MSSSGQGEGTGGGRSDPSGLKTSLIDTLKQKFSNSSLRMKFSGTSLDKLDSTESQSVPPVPPLPQEPIPTTTGGPSAVSGSKASIEPPAKAKTFFGGPIAPFKDLDPHMPATTSHVGETKSLSHWSDSTAESPSSPESASDPASPATPRSVDTFGNPRDFYRPGSLSAAMATRTSAAPESANPTNTRVSGSGQGSDTRRHTFGGPPESDKEGPHTQ